MRLLLSNDDGIDASGLAALESALAPLASEVWVCAPSVQHSAQSHALSLHKPLRARERGKRRFSVSGTPADSVYLGLHGLIDGAPDLVVSGINNGSNLGSDVFYSGTVAAAREATLSGFPSMAISLDRQPGDGGARWHTAQHVARNVVEQLLSQPLPAGIYLNVNVPNIEIADLRGIAAATLSHRVYDRTVDARRDPRGHAYYWIGGDHARFEGDDRSDGKLVDAGWATVTPMHTDPTDHPTLNQLRAWTDV